MKGQLIVVIGRNDIDEAKLICKALVESGITSLKIAFNLPKTKRLICDLEEEFSNALIGAGTVSSRGQTKLAIDNGADFIVSPCIVEEVGAYYREKDTFCSMGATTPTKVYSSYLAGSDVIKLFPGDCISMKTIRGIKAPMPFIEIVPTGGVDDMSVKEWLKDGAYATEFGGYLTKGIDASNLDILKRRYEKLI